VDPRLLAWNSLTGEFYGSEDQSIFLYALAKMQRPRNILELGTGLGHTALWLAQAAQENGAGHVWTVDNGARWPETLTYVAQRRTVKAEPSDLDALVADAFDIPPTDTDHVTRLSRLAAGLGLADHVTFLDGTLSLADTNAVTAQSEPFLAEALERPIDVLYADFDHYPHAILTVLTKYLPLLSESASIFIDSAASYTPAYLALEHTVDQLNHGKLPAIFCAGTTRTQREQLAEIVATRQFTHVALPETKDRNQNGLAWLRVEPANIVPYPLTRARGLFAAPLPASALEELFEHGALPETDVRHSFLFEQFVRAAYPLSESELTVLLALIAGRETPADRD
jgi:cephalosporin hydroxylase